MDRFDLPFRAISIEPSFILSFFLRSVLLLFKNLEDSIFRMKNSSIDKVEIRRNSTNFHSIFFFLYKSQLTYIEYTNKLLDIYTKSKFFILYT